MPNSAFQCGLMNSYWTGRDHPCQGFRSSLTGKSLFDFKQLKLKPQRREASGWPSAKAVAQLNRAWSFAAWIQSFRLEALPDASLTAGLGPSSSGRSRPILAANSSRGTEAIRGGVVLEMGTGGAPQPGSSGSTLRSLKAIQLRDGFPGGAPPVPTPECASGGASESRRGRGPDRCPSGRRPRRGRRRGASGRGARRPRARGWRP